MTIEQLKALPKAELHCHLDGSLSRPFIEKRLGRTVRPEELSVSENCTSLNEYLEKFDLPGRCIMDEEYSRKSLACLMTAQALQNTLRNFRFRVSVLWMKKGLRQLATTYFAP